MKKLKLFLSLCMMCLCVAVLCMGILAASSATYNINGNISYNMVDGVALVNTRVYKVAGTTTESDLSTQCTTLSTKSFEEIERETSPYYILSQKLDSQPLINTSNKTSASNTKRVNIVYGAVDSGVEYYTYYVVIQIRNMSTDTGYVLKAYLETVTTPTKSSVVVNATESSVVSIKSGSYSNVIVALTYTGTSTDKDEDSFEYKLHVDYVESGWPLELKCYTGKSDCGYEQHYNSSFWYVELGYTGATDSQTGEKIKIKWRLCSLDGETRYVYNDTKPEYSSGALFMQMSPLMDGTSTKTIAFDETGSTTNYFNSSIRKFVNDCSSYGLTETEMKTYIKPRTIESIKYGNWGIASDGSIVSEYIGEFAESTDTSGINEDYFWLGSFYEKEWTLACGGIGESCDHDPDDEHAYKYHGLEWLDSVGTCWFWFIDPSSGSNYSRYSYCDIAPASWSAKPNSKYLSRSFFYIV